VFLFGLIHILVTVSANPCAGNVGRLYVPADSCDTYYLCENSVATKMTCPIGFLFDFYLQACNYGNLENCNDPCFGVPNARFVVRRWAGCGAFYACQNGIGTPGNCPDGLYFDYEQQACNDPNNIDCIPDPSTAPTVPPTPPTISATTATTTMTTTTPTTTTTPAPSGPCAGYGNGILILYPPNGCGGYQRCENGISVSFGQCNEGFYFSYERQSCRIATQVVCNI
jgi:hypothetical protein